MLYTKNDMGLPTPVSSEMYKPTTSEALGAAWDSAMATNPLQSMENLMLGENDFSQMSEEDVIAYAQAERANPAPRMPVEEQKRYISESGLEGELTPHPEYSREVLEIIAAKKKEELANAYIYEKSSTGQATLGLGAGLVASMTDPFNLASTLVPVPGLGAVKVMSMMGKAGSLLGRTAIRAGEGAVAGALGAAMIEPFVYFGQQAAQADYGALNSLMNLGFGAVFGAGLKSAGGAIGDLRRNYHNSHLKPGEFPKAAPWEYVPRSEETEALRLQHEKEMYRALLATDAGKDPEALRQHVADTVEMYDIWQRRVAYDRQMPIEEVYNRWKIDYETGEIYDAALQEAQGAIKEAEDLRLKIEQSEENASSAQPDAFDLNEARARLDELEKKLPQARELLAIEDARANGQVLNQTRVASRPNAAAGNATFILGATSKDSGQYEVWELADIIASHDPQNRFARRPNYPKEAQERPYHSDTGEQEKVRGNAARYEPALVINDNPRAGNGPPIITKDGIVLGGNSRAMTLELVYSANGEASAAYRQRLKDKASQFGYDPAKLDGMSQPVLVRVLDENFDLKTLAKKSREYNQTDTQQLQMDAEAISRSRFLTPATIQEIGAGIDANGSLNKFLGTSEAARIIHKLQDDGVILESEYSSLTKKNGLPNEHAKKLIQTVLRGSVVDDYDVLSALPASMQNKIDALVPAVVRTRAAGSDWDLGPAITDALRLVNHAKANKLDLGTWLHQIGIFPGMKDNPVLQTLALTMEKAKAKEIRSRLEIYAAEAEKGVKNQVSMLGAAREVTFDSAFRKAFLKPLVTIDGMNFSDFRPQGNVVHAALDWALKNGGKRNKIEKIIEKLTKHLKNDKYTPEEKALFHQHITELSPFVGKAKYFEVNPGLRELGGKQVLEMPKFSKRLDEGPRRPLFPKAEGKAENPPDNQMQPGKASAAAREETLANVTFMANGKSIIRFFKSSNFSSAPHELYHVIQRQLEEIANSDTASLQMRQMWQAACDFVGANPGEKWTVEQHEKFARAGERYLWNGQTPNAQMQPILERVKERFHKVYEDVKTSGLEISNEMQAVFDSMYMLPIAEREARFNAELKRLLDYGEPGQFHDLDMRLSQFDAAYGADLEADIQAAKKLVNENMAEADALLQTLEQSSNPVFKEYALEARDEIKQADAIMELAQKKGEWMDKLLQCRMARGH